MTHPMSRESWRALLESGEINRKQAEVLAIIEAHKKPISEWEIHELLGNPKNRGPRVAELLRKRLIVECAQYGLNPVTNKRCRLVAYLGYKGPVADPAPRSFTPAQARELFAAAREVVAGPTITGPVFDRLRRCVEALEVRQGLVSSSAPATGLKGRLAALQQRAR